MATVHKTFAVTLTIPDNEAYTAGETLRRIGLPVAHVRRSTIWSFEVEAAAAERLPATIAALETIVNPNTHALSERAHTRPSPGEVWIASHDDASSGTVAGVALEGVRRIVRRTAWQLLDSAGANVDSAVLDRAVETFLCNPAFQKAIR